MGTDIHAILEKRDNNNDWHPVKKRDEQSLESYNSLLDSLIRDNKKHMVSLFNGYKQNLKDLLKKAENTMNWFHIGRDYVLFSILSNVRNDNYKTLKHFSDSEYNSFFEEDNISDDARDYFDDDGFFHSFTIIYEDDLEDINLIAKENYEEGRLNKDDFNCVKITLKYLNDIIESSRESKDEEFRFLIAYDN